MATLILGAVGTAIGTAVGGTATFLGLSAGAVGGMIGSGIGSVVDAWIVQSLMPGQKFEGQRLDAQRITSSTEGAVIPRVFGTTRIGGNVIWATDFREEVKKTTQGGKGGGPEVETTEYTYYASFAVGICEGQIGGIGRVWADGELLDMSNITMRVYRGTESQEQDPLIAAIMGADATPAYRGTAYAVFEDLLLTDFGNRIPQITFEVFRPLTDSDTAEGLVKAVTLIPATGEFAYSTQIVKTGEDYINSNAAEGRTDLRVSLDQLEALAPNVESVSLVVAWFGNDLRCGNCLLKPGVETASRSTTPISWAVNGVSRASAYLVSSDGNGRPNFGGTPSDASIVQAIKALRNRGIRVTFYPFILMDIPGGNTLPNPYSDNAAGVGQPAFPWRGRITCSPAPGYAGTVDKTAAASGQVSAFFGSGNPGSFTISGETVSWNGSPTVWGYRRMILHYAHLCAVAGGVDSFLIGSELRGLTQIRANATNNHIAVMHLRNLAADVRTILGPGTKISYAADWSEYFGHHPNDGTGDVYFHLDRLWADSNIDFVGIDNYMPLSDWRDGWSHLDAMAGAPSIYDLNYLQGNVEGGEGYDWFYASQADRNGQVRTPITDGAFGKPWVFRYKDIRSWWTNVHRNRQGGVEVVPPSPVWVPQSKPIRFTEIGCPAIDRGSNQPNVFHDPKSSESLVPHYSRAWRDDAIQRAYLEAMLGYWADTTNNPLSSAYSGRMVDMAECAVWTWDARPYPHFPGLTDIWADGDNWRLGHWLNGRLGAVSLRALVRKLCRDAGLSDSQIDVSGLRGAIEGYAIGSVESPKTSIAMLARHFGFDACESGGSVRFVSRGQAPAGEVTLDDLVRRGDGAGEVIEMVRGQETEIPQALKWQLSRNDEEFDAVVVEARRSTVDSTRIAAETFPLVVPPEEADRRCRRALQEAWVGRERASFFLPPSRLALDPTDVLTLDHDGRAYEFRLVQIGDSDARAVESIRQDRDVYDLPPGVGRQTQLRRPVLYRAPSLVFLDVPLLTSDQQAHRPLLAASSSRWPGQMAVYRSEEEDEGYQLLTTFSQRARIGALAFPFHSGPVDRFDHGNELYVDLAYGTLVSITDNQLFSGGNALAIESAPGVWEVVQAATVELVSAGRYKLTRLLRGQRGTEWAMGAVVPAGATVVVLDQTLVELPISEEDVGTPWHWRVGPASKPVSDTSYRHQQFTPQGRGLEPFSGVHAVQPYRRGREAGDLTIQWIRRSRALSADIWGNGEVPLGEESAAYEVDILDGPGIKRTLSSSTTSVVYTAAQQTADWGAPLAPGTSLRIDIYQVAPVAGRGFVYSETLYF
ncbi:glycoside hydrolase TIM-barrel-like domain-containing protein [Paracoccus sp. J55]|uniref:baseplate multidomain protein megatron n=1 Tax=Paracoccus sp. J55 TaxID=935849 RepID=UPI00048F363B|nr:glycoside hydrolase TIM-barrel-like domain-containing protein [Paracoccus sp. J55]